MDLRQSKSPTQRITLIKYTTTQTTTFQFSPYWRQSSLPPTFKVLKIFKIGIKVEVVHSKFKSEGFPLKLFTCLYSKLKRIELHVF